ncbi:MAG TPA: hypothetical protein VEL07_08060 [Planctomycetota bacterium]|nr:hypothetical protein [Planctomycetota bacterium]
MADRRRILRVVVWLALTASAGALDLPPGDLALPDDVLVDADGCAWRLASDGALAEQAVEENGAFESAATLTIDNQGYVGGAVHVLRLADDAEPWYVFPVQALPGGLEVARFAQLSRADGVCRWLDVVANAGAARRAVIVRVAHQFIHAPRGLDRVGARGREVGAALHFGSRVRPAVALWWGDCRPSLRLGSAAVGLEHTVELAPGECAALVHAVAVRPGADAAGATAAALDDERLCRGLPWIANLTLANARGPGAGIDPLRAANVDTIILVGGERLRGALLSDGLTLVGGERVAAGVLAGAVRRGGGAFLVQRDDGDARVGALADATVSIALPSGSQTSVPVARLAALAMRARPRRPTPPAAWDWQAIDGGRRALGEVAAPLRLATVLGEIAIPAHALVELLGCDDGPFIARLSDGSRIAGLPLDATLRVVDAAGARELPLGGLARLRQREPPTVADDAGAFLVTLINGDRVRGQLTAALRLGGRDGTHAIDPAALRALAIGPARARASVHFIDGAQLDGRLAEPLRLRTAWCAELAIAEEHLAAIAVDLPARARRALVEQARAHIAALGGDDAAGVRVAGEWLAAHGAALRGELEQAYADHDLPRGTRRRLGLILGQEF